MSLTPSKLAVTMNARQHGGQSLVEDIGGGLYVGYAHLIPGTITVKAGEQVHRGQVLGRLGNSGNSTEPHLHLQVCNAPSFLICEGVPMEFQRMSLTKYRIQKRGETPVKLDRREHARRIRGRADGRRAGEFSGDQSAREIAAAAPRRERRSSTSAAGWRPRSGRRRRR